jgi:hypothetical protein
MDRCIAKALPNQTILIHNKLNISNTLILSNVLFYPLRPQSPHFEASSFKRYTHSVPLFFPLPHHSHIALSPSSSSHPLPRSLTEGHNSKKEKRVRPSTQNEITD